MIDGALRNTKRTSGKGEEGEEGASKGVQDSFSLSLTLSPFRCSSSFPSPYVRCSGSVLSQAVEEGSEGVADRATRVRIRTQRDLDGDGLPQNRTLHRSRSDGNSRRGKGGGCGF